MPSRKHRGVDTNIATMWTFLPISGFTEAAPHWDALNRSTANLPILGSQFFSLAMTHFPPRQGAKLAFLREQDRWIGAAIVERPKVGVWQTYQPSQAPIGAWLSSPGLNLAPALHGFIRRAPGMSFALGITQLDPL